MGAQWLFGVAHGSLILLGPVQTAYQSLDGSPGREFGCGCRRAGAGATERTTFAELRAPKEALPPADAKPQYHTIVATVAQIDPQQSLYYEASPDNNRKVLADWPPSMTSKASSLQTKFTSLHSLHASEQCRMPPPPLASVPQKHFLTGKHCASASCSRTQVVQQGDGWYCEYDGQTYMAMVRRYVMQAKCVDASGEALLSVFNEQVQLACHPLLTFFQVPGRKLKRPCQEAYLLCFKRLCLYLAPTSLLLEICFVCSCASASSQFGERIMFGSPH